MAQAHSRRQECAALLTTLNEEHGWGLSLADQQRYVERLVAILPDGELAHGELSLIITRYHLDHDLVDSLRDQGHHMHGERMRAWVAQALRILRRTGLSWSDDAAVDSDDLVQIACAELARALPSFQYNSRFSTWAHQVITRSVQRYLRDSRAKKRGQRPSSLDQEGALAVPIGDGEHPEALGDASVLRALVDDVLCNLPDQRLSRIFQMWQDEDQPIAEIGRQLRLSPQRTRALLAATLDQLRHDPTIRAWVAGQDE